MADRETCVVAMAPIGVPDVEPQEVQVYVDDGTPVDPKLLQRNSTPADQAADGPIIVTRAELADMIADAAAAAVAAQQSTPGATAEIRQAARAALTEETQ